MMFGADLGAILRKNFHRRKRVMNIGDEFVVKTDIHPCRVIDLEKDSDGVIWIKFVEGRVQFDVEVYKILNIAKGSDDVIHIMLDKDYNGWSMITKAKFIRDFEKIINTKPA